MAVVVPLSASPDLTADERLTLDQLDRVLGGYDRFFLAPAGHRATRQGYSVVQLPGRYFGSAQAHARLMLSRRLYERFRAYEFILLHHLDALTLRDELGQWCDAGYDYIGAPWLRCPERPEEGFAGVGNGGFSLRRVSSFLKVLRSWAYTVAPADYRERWRRRFGGRSLPVRLANAPRLALKYLPLFNGVGGFVAGYPLNEDRFWSEEARRYYPALRIAPPEVALRFAFEKAPRYSSQLLGGRLPFGCHGWTTNDRAFWESAVFANPRPAEASPEAYALSSAS